MRSPQEVKCVSGESRCPTLAVGEDGHAVDVVGVAVVHLDTLSCHQPPSDARVVAAGEELRVADDGEPPHAVLVTYGHAASPSAPPTAAHARTDGAAEAQRRNPDL